MQIGVSVPGVTLQPGAAESWAAKATADDMLRVARKADDLGFDFLGVPEHAIMLEKMVPCHGAALAAPVGDARRLRRGDAAHPFGQHRDRARLSPSGRAGENDLDAGLALRRAGHRGLGVGYLRREFAIVGGDTPTAARSATR